jgi:hypothetical protein
MINYEFCFTLIEYIKKKFVIQEIEKISFRIRIEDQTYAVQKNKKGSKMKKMAEFSLCFQQ